MMTRLSLLEQAESWVRQEVVDNPLSLAIIGCVGVLFAFGILRAIQADCRGRVSRHGALRARARRR